MGRFKDAELLLKITKESYQTKEKMFREKEKETNEALQNLDNEKLNAWKNFSEFVSLFESISNKPVYIEGEVAREDINISPDELKELKMNISVSSDILSAVTRSGIAGIATGTAVAGGAVTAGAVATMGLSWVGVSGGFEVATSMAGNWLALSGLKAGALLGPLAAIPAIAIGIATYNKTLKNTENQALSAFASSIEAERKLGDAIDNIELVNRCASVFAEEIKALEEYYNAKVQKLKVISQRRRYDYNNFSEDDIYVLESTILLVKFIKSYLEVQLITNKEEDSKEPESTQYDPSHVISKIKESLFFRQKMEFDDGDEDAVVVSEKMLTDVVDRGACYVAPGPAYKRKNYLIRLNHILGVEGTLFYEDCVVEANCDIPAAIQVNEGYAYFKNCTFVQKKKLPYCFISSYYGMVIFDNCKFVDLDFSQGTFEHDWSEKTLPRSFAECIGEETKGYIYVKDCDFVNCKGLMFTTQGRAMVTLERCNIINHQGTFAMGRACESGDTAGYKVSACRFEGMKKGKVPNIDSIFYINDSTVICSNSIFENNDGYILRSAYYDDDTYRPREFKNCEVDGKLYEDDLPSQYCHKNDYREDVDY